MDRANALRRAEPMRRASTIRADYSCAFVQVRLHPVRPRRLVRSSARADASNHESRGFALPKESSGVRAYTRLMLFVSFACVRACVRACVHACVRACVRARVRALFLEAAKKNRLESPKELCTVLDPQERAYAFRDTNTSVLRNFFTRIANGCVLGRFSGRVSQSCSIMS